MKKKERQYTEKQLKRIRQQNAFAPGRWMQVPWDFFLLMSEPCAIMMSYLINFARRKRAEQDHAGWFYCTTSTMSKEMPHLNRDAQHHRLRLLHDEGFIEMIRKGCPAKRFIYINYDILEEKLQEHEQEILEREASMENED